MRTMARTEPPSEITCLTNWDTTQVGANTEHDQPLGFLRPGLVALWVSKRLPVGCPSLLDLVGRTVTNEDRLPAPFDDYILAFGNIGELDLSLCERKDIGRGGHRLKEASDRRLGDRGGEDAKRANHKVRHGAVGFVRLGAVWREIGDLGGVFCNSRGMKETGLVEGRYRRSFFI